MNYSGPTFAVAFETTLNNAYFTSPNTKFTVSWSMSDNTLTMTQIDNWDKVTITIVSDADRSEGRLWRNFNNKRFYQFNERYPETR